MFVLHFLGSIDWIKGKESCDIEIPRLVLRLELLKFWDTLVPNVDGYSFLAANISGALYSGPCDERPPVVRPTCLM